MSHSLLQFEPVYWATRVRATKGKKHVELPSYQPLKQVVLSSSNQLLPLPLPLLLPLPLPTAETHKPHSVPWFCQPAHALSCYDSYFDDPARFKGSRQMEAENIVSKESTQQMHSPSLHSSFHFFPQNFQNSYILFNFKEYTMVT
jgi:hypothetical protein